MPGSRHSAWIDSILYSRPASRTDWRAQDAAALAATAVLVGAIFAIAYTSSVAVRTTVTEVVTTTSVAGTKTLTNFSPGELYEVTFLEGSGGVCGGYIYPWGVQVGNLTISQPPGVQPYQFSTNGYNASAKFDLNTIVFSLPSGTYPFTIYTDYFLRPAYNATGVGDVHVSSGILTVTNSSLTIETVPLMIC